MTKSRLFVASPTKKITRQELTLAPISKPTAIYRPIPHFTVATALVETLDFRRIKILAEEYVLSKDGMNMFGVVDIEEDMKGARFVLGIRNSNSKMFRLAVTLGYRVLVCGNLAFTSDYAPVLAKHTKGFNLNHALSAGVDDMMRNFESVTKSVERWRTLLLSDAAAKLIIYRAFTESKLETSRHLDRAVHDFYFNPQFPDFRPRTMWSLSNAFTSALNKLHPIPQYQATARLAKFFNSLDDKILSA